MSDKHLGTFDEIPTEFKGDIIENAFYLAELANMSHKDRHAYELSLKYYRDFINVLDTTKKDAKLEEKQEIALKMLQKKMDIELVMEVTDLSKQTLENLLQKNQRTG
jgi:predicted transposase/invertase (TIGR01784 family)